MYFDVLVNSRASKKIFQRFWYLVSSGSSQSGQEGVEVLML